MRCLREEGGVLSLDWADLLEVCFVVMWDNNVYIRELCLCFMDGKSKYFSPGDWLALNADRQVVAVGDEDGLDLVLEARDLGVKNPWTVSACEYEHFLEKDSSVVFAPEYLKS